MYRTINSVFLNKLITLSAFFSHREKKSWEDYLQIVVLQIQSETQYMMKNVLFFFTLLYLNILFVHLHVNVTINTQEV